MYGIKDCLPTKTSATYLSTRPLVYLSTRLLIVFIVFSYRRSSDVMCADRYWKLVYRWISAHITLLVEHPPISGSFMFFSITTIRIIRGRQKEIPWRSVSSVGKEKTAPHITHEAVI